MRVTATHLAQWSDQRVAQEMLPILIRRLISATSSIKAITMPGGDSVNVPGWDGVVDADKGNAWVPNGLSYWELGTSNKPQVKAQGDYDKRLNELSVEKKAESIFVFVTPRRWPGKIAWQTKVRSQNVWADVLVWDADDLEAWLETSASTELWVAIQLGIAGHGIDSVENYWDHWRHQSNPALTASALLIGRENPLQELRDHVEKRKGSITVIADSQSEAVAFVCAYLIEEGHSLRAVCVTSDEGWQFVDSNSGIELVLVTDNQIARHRSPRSVFNLIYPMATGDQSFNFNGVDRSASSEATVELSRPKPDEFENSLLALGLAPSDAARYTRSLGRSWTVFRRRHAISPVIQKPSWADRSNNIALQILTLVGAWNSDSSGDRECIAQIANTTYEDIENELIQLAALDDAPVLKIGALWKAKAPLELLYLMTPRLTTALLSRFFFIAKSIFENPDPALELEENKRWMASIYGKVREHSGVVLDAIAASMAKLGYFFESYDDIGNVNGYVRNFVSKLLANANEERWLSMSSYLRSFAEAAPDEFLVAIKNSLENSEKSVLRLLTETQASGAFDRCWHANLLWALEILAWYPARLQKVTNILAQLSLVEIKGNWTNTPFNSLASLFRPWCPQTSASVEIRFRAVSQVVNQNPEIGWRLLLALTPRQNGFSSPNAKPNWRDDDAGAGGGVAHDEYDQFVLAIGNMLLDKARNNAVRISDLVPIIDFFDIGFRDSVISLVSSATQFDDEGRELVRSALRKLLSWENSFNQQGENHDRFSADALRPMFDILAAKDLIIRHAWIFSNGWMDLPDGCDEDYKEADLARAELRAKASREIYEAHGWQGIERLAKCSSDSRLIGWELVKDPFGRKDLVEWLCQWYLKFEEAIFNSLTCGVLYAVPKAERIDFLCLCIQQLVQLEAPASRIAEFLSNAPQEKYLWKLVEELQEDIFTYFWSVVRPSYIDINCDDLIFCIEKLLAAKRPRTALDALGDGAANFSCELLVQMLDDLAVGREPNGPFPQSWHLSRVFKALNLKQEAQADLVRLEFAYYEILQYDDYGTPNLMAEIWRSPEFFMELICLAYKPRNSQQESLPENMQGDIQRASSVLYNGRGVPGLKPDGSIDSDVFLTWASKVRELAKEKDCLVVTDLKIGEWLSDWPYKKNLELWPDPIIAELLDQEDAEDIRRGFYTGVHNSRGVSSRSPYAGGDQERKIADKFIAFSVLWENSKPNVAALIEGIAKSFQWQAKRRDEDGLWTQELD